jgi:hypothetical protein
MVLLIENYTTGFRILNGETVLLKANHVKWYRDAISYECGDKKGLMEPLDLLGTKSNVITDDRLSGEIIWNWKIPNNISIFAYAMIFVLPWFWGRYLYSPNNSSSSYYLKEPEILMKLTSNNHSYSLINTSDNETILSITGQTGLFSSKCKIHIDYYGSHIDEDLLAFAVFAFKSTQRGNRRPMYT